MKNQHLKKELIRLRALGISYDKIAQAINVSKPSATFLNKKAYPR